VLRAAGETETTQENIHDWIFIMRLMMTQNRGRNMLREQQIKQNVDTLVFILLFFQVYCCVDCPYCIYHISYVCIIHIYYIRFGLSWMKETLDFCFSGLYFLNKGSTVIF
jgi:hypothetical protein